VATAAKPAAKPARAASPRLAGGGFLAFRLPGVACALPLDRLREVVPMALLSRPPGMPSLLEGLLNLGGAAVAVVRLDRLLGLPELSVGLYTPLLVLRHAEDRVALLVESVVGLITVRPEDVRPTPGASLEDCVEGEVDVGGLTVHLLDPDRLLLEKERQCLAEFAAAEQGRLRRLEEARP
jgi:purine-binding chemotaxis protein CheW